MIVEDQLNEAGEQLRGAVAERSPRLGIDDGLADLQRRRRGRTRRRRVSTVMGALAAVLVVAVVAFGAARDEGQQVATGAGGASGDARPAIRAAVSTLFGPGPSADEKLALVDDSGDLRDVIVQGMQDPRAAQLTVELTEIEVRGAEATAHMDFFLSGTLAMPNGTLEFTLVGDRWLVRRDSYCGLIATTGPRCPGDLGPLTEPTEPAANLDDRGESGSG